MNITVKCPEAACHLLTSRHFYLSAFYDLFFGKQGNRLNMCIIVQTDISINILKISFLSPH